MSTFDKQTLLHHIYSLLSKLDRRSIRSVEISNGGVVAFDGEMRVTVDFRQWEDEPNTLGVEIFTHVHGLAKNPVSTFIEADVVKEPHLFERLAQTWVHNVAGLLLSFLNRESTRTSNIFQVFPFSVNDSIGFSQCEGFITPLRFEPASLSKHQRDFMLTKNRDRELLETMNLKELCPCFFDFIDDDEWHFVDVASFKHKINLFIDNRHVFELSNSIPKDNSSRQLIFDIRSSHFAIVKRNNNFVPETEEEKIDAVIREFVTYCHRTPKADWTKACLQNAGFDADVAHHLLDFVRLAFGRILAWNYVQKTWSETYSLVKKDGTCERHLPLNQVLMFRRALLIGECYHTSRRFEQAFRQLAESSAEADALSHLNFILKPRPKTLRLEEPVFCEPGTIGVLYNKVRNEILGINKNTTRSKSTNSNTGSETSYQVVPKLKRKPKKKWWQFWK